AFDEFHNRSMVIVGVIDVAALGKGGNDDERDARTVTEEVQRLEVAGIPVTAAFVKGNDEGRIFGQFVMALEPGEKAVDKRFKYVQLGAGRMSVTKAVRFQIGHCR